jgi:hypothetical protein
MSRLIRDLSPGTYVVNPDSSSGTPKGPANAGFFVFRGNLRDSGGTPGANRGKRGARRRPENVRSWRALMVRLKRSRNLCARDYRRVGTPIPIACRPFPPRRPPAAGCENLPGQPSAREDGSSRPRGRTTATTGGSSGPTRPRRNAPVKRPTSGAPDSPTRAPAANTSWTTTSAT